MIIEAPFLTFSPLTQVIKGITSIQEISGGDVRYFPVMLGLQLTAATIGKAGASFSE
jgi:hypothetical protein